MGIAGGVGSVMLLAEGFPKLRVTSVGDMPSRTPARSWISWGEGRGLRRRG